MKRTFYLTATLALSFFAMSFVLTSDSNSNVYQNGYSSWETTSCLKHLMYQIKKDDYAGKWYIRFKNNYNESVSLSIEVKGNTGDKDDSGRFTIRSGSTANQYYFVDANASRISFSIDKIKFNDTSWGGPYANCDH